MLLAEVYTILGLNPTALIASVYSCDFIYLRNMRWVNVPQVLT